jgi:hypothetical protein
LRGRLAVNNLIEYFRWNIVDRLSVRERKSPKKKQCSDEKK